MDNSDVDEDPSWYIGDQILTPAGGSVSHASFYLTPNQLSKLEEADSELVRFTKIVKRQSHPKIVAFDVEKYDRARHNEILELGVDIITKPSLESALNSDSFETWTRKKSHYIAKNNQNLKNKWCKNDRYAFAHGESAQISEVAMMYRVRDILDSLKSLKGVLVGHTINSDIKFLETRSQELNDAGKINFTIDFNTVETIDIALVDRALRQDFQSKKLASVGAEYGVEFQGSPHNAGNDAVFTMSTFIAMAKYVATLPGTPPQQP